MSGKPLLLYIPGLRAKPPPRTHRRELFRCLVEGVRRIDAESANAIQQQESCFDLVSWTYDFYGKHRDIELDMPAIEGLLQQPEATQEDMQEAVSLKRRSLRWLYHLADYLPFLVPQLADERLELHLRDLRRYVHNEFEVADAIRRLVSLPLRAAAKGGRPILLIGHSMGSVIAYEALWQMSRDNVDDVRVDLLITMGSPLGQRTIQRSLKGSTDHGSSRYPNNIRRWVNIAAFGELTAVDMTLRNDFAEMIELGLVEEIEDHAVFNYYRSDGELNVHAEYGYLINETCATQVRDWWRANA
ncbi:MAG TPA: hypothetical protein VF389_04905 [Woeseiaceae bacterium]